MLPRRGASFMRLLPHPERLHFRNRNSVLSTANHGILLPENGGTKRGFRRFLASVDSVESKAKSQQEKLILQKTSLHTLLGIQSHSNSSWNLLPFSRVQERFYSSQETSNSQEKSPLAWTPNLESRPNIDAIRELEYAVTQYANKNGIQEDLHGHFDSLIRYEHPQFRERIIQFLLADSFEFGDSPLELYLKSIKCLFGSHNEAANVSEAVALLQDLELESYAPALEALAILSYEKDFDEAVLYHNRASSLGFLESTVNFGCFLIDNSTRREDIKAGVDLIVESANRNFVPAMLFLARLFCMGRNRIPSNPQLCYAWGQAAFRHGSVEGGGYYGIGLISEQQSPAEVTKGKNLLRAAAEAGYIDMQGHYGYLAVTSLGLVEEGAKYLQMHTEREDCLTHTLYTMGDLYLEGRGVEQDVDKALATWQRGAEMKDGYCIAVLAEIYSGGYEAQGVSIVPDFEKAAQYYEMSVKYFKSAEAQRKLDSYKKYKRFF